ncbi:glycine dehydrogenase (decarboxylating) alpha subunit /glycine dehydrogenase (decarboxylating) beta subunit [Jatrophihabitans endophyticus]|uniref:Glycine dehydrogenase (decarboxylating) n=1 Tax=Jatrophihabitans endophyticus TaxID=1206085 RepID=A0A1M5MRN4_9ACTN|nr:aminomethyl-transferring glycine dehydrogenase [Jatrophihabitans endophyticus]SHG80034.1 glycine dehydrogenase (decarboxylating) alpha subunit /glycine dehydrogenase (decarboxylating) beta subunit [Jatrophihabitans endophyticus]
MSQSLSDLEHDDVFAARHIGPTVTDQQRMLETLGYASLDDLLGDAVPAGIREQLALALPDAASEAQVAAELRALAGRNQVLTSMIGLGYFGTITPPVIRRTVLENPSWYTAYTPYQPEISQGRLEALINFQTMVEDLTGLAVAGASVLDEGTAAAEAMALAHRAAKNGNTFVVDADVLPQTLDVVRTRAVPLGLKVVTQELDDPLPEGDVFGVLVQYPAASGRVRDLGPIVAAAHERGAQAVVAADLLALTVLASPGAAGADIAVGTTQRFGVPLGFGGPHAGYLAVRSGLERQLPGRLVGVSVDADGAPAYRLALQTREQHIRREKATSNICTAQVLLAVMASMYAVYHGPDGLRAIARRVHRLARVLAEGLAGGGCDVLAGAFFDTVTVTVGDGRADEVVAAALAAGINLRRVDERTVSVSCDETTTREHVVAVWRAFGVDHGLADVERLDREIAAGGSTETRTTDFLTHPVFNTHHSETSMLRYLRRLADRDYALDRGMIPLGSCTMKLNATTEMEPVTNPGFANVHPFAPEGQFDGYAQVIADLQSWLCEITGYDAVSLQPNAGAQGEFAGLLAIHQYHQGRGDHERDVCLIPASAHGTNAASAVMAGLRVVVVKTGGDQGEIDLDDLRAKIAQHADRLAAIMVTYPSTHGVFEEHIGEVCALVHDAGGQVYVDGANLNAMVGLARPGRFGADVSHLNLHKTFCIPHGGGGPGVGPVAVRAHLAGYLPNHPLQRTAGPEAGSGAISAAPWGSAAILPITWAYIRLMGAAGLTAATGAAILSANYVAKRLAEHYPVLYSGTHGLVAHECILDLRGITKATGVTVDDVAKRLIDYGFHAPTMSFPVAGTLMVEPTESEDLAELDRFVAAMIAIKGEIDRVAAGEWPVEDNPLRNAPHTAESVTGEWTSPYPRELAAFPPGVDKRAKYWPPVRRIDGAFGDRNLVCACPPVSEFA